VVMYMGRGESLKREKRRRNWRKVLLVRTNVPIRAITYSNDQQLLY